MRPDKHLKSPEKLAPEKALRLTADSLRGLPAAEPGQEIQAIDSELMIDFTTWTFT
jgi:hypothetical protein